MLNLLTGLLLVLIGPDTSQAYPRVLICTEMFRLEFKTTFDFAPELALNLPNRLVSWKGHVFPLGRHQLAILQRVLAAQELASIDDLVVALYGHDGGGEAPELTIKAQIYHIRKAFQAVDPEFDRLQTVKGKGLYWQRSREQTSTIQHGPLSAALHVPLAWWHETSIKLAYAEQSILIRLLKRPSREINVESFTGDHASINSIRVILCNLNAKFEKITGHRLIVAGKKGFEEGAIRLNPRLF